MSAEARFRALYETHGDSVLAYLLRRTSDAWDAADLLADTFVVVWRRIDDVPPGDRARPWLYGVARRTLANHRRGAARRDALVKALGSTLEQATVSAPPPVDAGLFDALRALGERDREILCLTAWERLTPKEIGRVLGMRSGSVRVRLHRARARLAAELGPERRPVAAACPGTRPNA